jgi:hypothetical protein
LPSSKLGISSSNRHHHLLNSILPKKLPFSFILQHSRETNFAKCKCTRLVTSESRAANCPAFSRHDPAAGQLRNNTSQKDRQQQQQKNSRKTFNELGPIEKNVMEQKETRSEQRKKKKKEKEEEEEDKKTILKSVS